MSDRLPCLSRLVAALAGLAAGFVLAADRPVDPLLQRRAEWRAQALQESKSLREQFAASLRALEKELVLSGDYSGAANAREERRQLLPEKTRAERTVPAPPGELVPDAPIELTAKSAAAAGGVSLDPETGALTGWKTAGAAVRWLLPAGITAGGYDVELTWSAPPAGGGEVLLKEDVHSLRRPVKPAGGAQDWQTAVIGTLRLVSASRMLELSAASVRGPELFRLKSVRLIPVAGRQ